MLAQNLIKIVKTVHIKKKKEERRKEDPRVRQGTDSILCFYSYSLNYRRPRDACTQRSWILVQSHLSVKWQSLDTNSDKFEITNHAHSLLPNVSPFFWPSVSQILRNIVCIYINRHSHPASWGRRLLEIIMKHYIWESLEALSNGNRMQVMYIWFKICW